MAKREYRSERFEFRPDVVDKAFEAFKQGIAANGVVEWRDLSTPGLTLRITKTTVVWYVRDRDVSIRIGPAERIRYDGAKYIVQQARNAAASGRDARTMIDILSGYETGGDRDGDERPARAVYAHMASDPNTVVGKSFTAGGTAVWTWEAMTEKFLAYKLPKLKKTYRDSYRGILELPAFRALGPLSVPSVKLGHLEKVRDDILRKRAASTAHSAVQQGKAMMTWAWRYFSGQSGLAAVEYEWWNRWSVEYRCGERKHVPYIFELVRTVALVEAQRDEADPMHAVAPGTMAALWAVVFTAQRTGALVQLERKNILDDPERPGWKVFHWTVEQMKGGKDGGRPHSLPVPPEAVAVLQRYWDECDEKLEAGPGREERASPWAFPSGKNDGHVQKSALNLLMRRLEGKATVDQRQAHPLWKGKPGPKPKARADGARPNLFARHGIEVWIPHDVRRTLANFLDDKNLGGTGSAILAHKHEKFVDERVSVAEVTRKHYAFVAQRLPLKAEGMKVWVEAVLEAYEREKRGPELTIAGSADGRPSRPARARRGRQKGGYDPVRRDAVGLRGS